MTRWTKSSCESEAAAGAWRARTCARSCSPPAAARPGTRPGRAGRRDGPAAGPGSCREQRERDDVAVELRAGQRVDLAGQRDARVAGHVRAGGRSPPARRSRSFGQRRVDDRAVGVAAAQRARGGGVGAVAERQLREPRGEDLARDAGGHERRAAQVAHRHLDPLEPAAARLVELDAAELAAFEVGRALVADPVVAVEVVEVHRLPVGGLARLDAQQLAPVARPVERSVAVLPAEARGLRGGVAERPGLVVEPRPVGVERGRRDQAEDRHRDGEHRGRAGVADPQALEPQVADHEHAQQRAADELRVQLDRDDGHGVERQQQDERHVAEAQLAARPGPERDQRRRDRERRAAEADHRAGPLVEAAVRHPRARQRGDAAPDRGRQLAPAVGPQQLVGDAAGGEGERHDRDRDEDGGGRPQRRAQAPGRQQAEHREHGGAERVARAVGGDRLEHVHPLERGEPAQQHEHQAARGGYGGGRAAGEVCPLRARAGDAHPVLPTAAIAAAPPVRPLT